MKCGGELRIAELDWGELADLGPEQGLRGVDARRVYMLDWGRNAWHSTWAVKYRPTSALFATRQAAEQEAETRRTQGTVFYIEVLPALVLSTGSDSFVLVDCHAATPFRGYVGCAPAPKGVLYPGASMAAVIRSFRHDSRYWKGQQPSPHALITGYVADVNSLEAWSDRPMRKWRSFSQGSEWPLGWSRTDPKRIRRAGLEKLVTDFGDLKTEQPRGSATEKGVGVESDGLTQYLMNRRT